MASRRLEEISKRAMFLNLFVFSLHVQFAALPHTITHPDPSYTHHTHTHLEFVSRACLSLSSMIFLGFAISCSGNVTAGSVYFFFFHADSLTRLSSWRKERSLLPSRTAAGKETKHNKSSRMLLYTGAGKHSEASPSCRLFVTKTVSSVCRHRISKATKQTKLLPPTTFDQALITFPLSHDHGKKLEGCIKGEEVEKGERLARWTRWSSEILFFDRTRVWPAFLVFKPLARCTLRALGVSLSCFLFFGT